MPETPELVDPYTTGVGSWQQLSYIQTYCSEVGQQTQDERTSCPSWGTSYTQGMTQEEPAVIPGPSRGGYLFHLTTGA